MSPEKFGPRKRSIPAASDAQVNKFIDYWAGLGWIGIYIYTAFNHIGPY